MPDQDPPTPLDANAQKDHGQPPSPDWAWLNFAQQKIHHENELVHHRMWWLWAIQGFLFSALGLATQSSDSFLALAAVMLISITGMTTAFSFAAMMQLSTKMIEKTKEVIDQGKAQHGAAHINGRLIHGTDHRHEADFHLFGIPCKYLGWVFPFNLLPKFFVIIWLFIGIANALVSVVKFVQIF